MKSDKKILFAFLLNLLFSVVEFVGGAITGSVAIVSDSLHDFGDSISIGVSYAFEKISKKLPDEKYSYGYVKYSVLGSVITTVILLVGSAFVIYNAIIRLLSPTEINYNGMIILAIFGAIVNLLATVLTKGEDSLNQKAVNLHMLEDVLGWIAVLIGAIVMKFTDFKFIDPLMSIAVAVFILINAVKNLKAVLDIFLEKTPVDIKEIEKHLLEIDGVKNIHHLHIWSVDGYSSRATLHIVTDSKPCEIKEKVREELKEHNILHATIEIEGVYEICGEKVCHIEEHSYTHNHHHHH